MSQAVNNFSLISRLFGNLFYREATDSVLAGVFTWLQQQGLAQIWPLDSDKQSLQCLVDLQARIDLVALNQEYHKLFGLNARVDNRISTYGVDVQAFKLFRQQQNMPEIECVDHFAILLLSASWIEDNLDSIAIQHQLFADFLLPCASKFLTQVENQASLPFYRSLARLTREILSAMADELEEEPIEAGLDVNNIEI